MLTQKPHNKITKKMDKFNLFLNQLIQNQIYISIIQRQNGRINNQAYKMGTWGVENRQYNITQGIKGNSQNTYKFNSGNGKRPT